MDILKPARYINHEWNAVHKKHGKDMLKVALCFPDIYEIGMSHLGMKIIYGLLNKQEGIVCERVFAPAIDMENKLRQDRNALCSLETNMPLKEFDVLGFSLQYEMNYVDALNVLDLSGIPVYSKDRGDADPIIMAGGACVFNPEVMADFIDVFVIGEGEDVILEVLKVLGTEGIKSQDRNYRYNVLKAIADIPGVYVPLMRQVDSNNPVKRRIVKDLDNSYFPADIVVPYIQIVHDRISVEVMRGCPHRCKFCQACRIFHPLRIRSVQRIMEILEESVRATGYEEISLLSLSSGDYPYIEDLMAGLEERFKGRGVKVTLPSLRVGRLDKYSETGILRKATLTIAPEAGRLSLRSLLNKNINDSDIVREAREALKTGWKKIKLYFMVGLPGETDEDLRAIIKLAETIVNGHKFNNIIHLSIAFFIPKPHSDFELEKMNSIEELKDKKNYLIGLLQVSSFKRHIRMDFHNVETAHVEAVLTRGNRDVGIAVFKMFQKRSPRQAWTEYFNYIKWQECFKEGNINTGDYLQGAKDKSNLPWGFIEL